MLDQDQTIGELVRKMEQEDRQGNTHISKYVNFGLRETIEKIEAYINSKHTTGETDSQGRDKPFFNIVIAARNIWYRATDIDRKDIKFKAGSPGDTTLAFCATILLQEYMKKSKFGVFLNDWGRTLATYGSAVSKHVEKGGELISEVVPWNRLICDPIDFDNNVKIEKLWLTPAQLRARKEYDQEYVESLIETKEARETMDGQKKDNKNDYIEVYEVHGELSLAQITGQESDEDTYVQQMHVISFIAKKDGIDPNSPEFNDYTLYKGKEAKSPYQITHLIKEDGRTLSIGAVENLFEAQWMMNHNVKAIKDQLDLASKLIFQTSDGNFVGQNALNSIENGEIVIHETGQPLTELNNSSHDIGALQSFGQQWEVQANKIDGISEAMAGQSAKSGTAWRQTQAELQESHSLFELMTENKGLGIDNMLRVFIIPHLKKKMDTADEISGILDEYQIKKIDSMFVPAEATRRINKEITNDILNKTPEDLEKGNLFTPEMQGERIAGEQEAIQNTLNTFENQRFIKPSDVDDKTWKEVLKDFEWDLDIEITGENKDTQAVMTTLTTIFQTIAGMGGQPMSPDMKLVLNKILSETGAVSPLEMNQASNEPMPMQAPMPQEMPQIQ